MKIRCPRCEKKLAIPDKFAGMTIRCPSCRLNITAPKTQAAVGGGLSEVDFDLEDLADLEAHTSQMSDEDRVSAERTITAPKPIEQEDGSHRLCPECGKKTKVQNPRAEVLCSNCWTPMPALVKGTADDRGRMRTGAPAAHVTGPGGFYGGLASSMAYPVPAIGSVLTAAILALCLALIPVFVLTVVSEVLQMGDVGSFRGVQQADLSGVQKILITVFTLEIFFFAAVAIHAFFDVVRTTSILNDKPPNLAFSVYAWGRSFVSYLILTGYLVIMTFLVAKLTIEDDVWAYIARGDIRGLIESGGSSFAIGMLIVSFFIPMNLVGISLGTIGQALNPINVAKSVVNTHVHYAFLVVTLAVYGGLFGYMFAALIGWFLPQVDLMIRGSFTGNVASVAAGLLAWALVMACFFYGSYILARLHGLFARSFRKDLFFGTR